MPQTPRDTSLDHESPAGIPSPGGILIDAAHHGQRLDNFLIATIKNVPRSRLYRAIRSGEVRINGGRAKPSSRLASGDQVRLPPLGRPAREQLVLERHALNLEERILYEDADLLIIDKPSGIPVHGGSGHSHGLIEQLMILRPGAQLVHRLDRPTSGCLLIAKHRPALLLLHGLLKQRLVKKHYLAMATGYWPGSLTTMDTPIARPSGHPGLGEPSSQRDALTHFQVMERFEGYTLLQATPITGRMHQIRLHAAAAGHPIAGDALYGSAPWNQAMRHLELRRLFLHAWRLEIPWQDSTLAIEAPWPAALLTVLQHLRESPRQSGAE